MRNPLHGHPTWRQLAILSLVLPTAVTFAILAFAWPAARLAPRGLPVGVVGTPRMSQELVAGLSPRTREHSTCACMPTLMR